MSLLANKYINKYRNELISLWQRVPSGLCQQQSGGPHLLGTLTFRLKGQP
jgi:hypothetical protein